MYWELFTGNLCYKEEGVKCRCVLRSSSYKSYNNLEYWLYLWDNFQGNGPERLEAIKIQTNGLLSQFYDIFLDFRNFIKKIINKLIKI